MENFLNLPERKQETVRNAALAAFGSLGYRKASINDIAKDAGVSKALMFHYFGTKKALYMYLVEYCGNYIVTEFNVVTNRDLDFFKRLTLATDVKIAALKKSPHVLKFINSMRAENDPEISEAIKSRAKRGGSGHSDIFISEDDSVRFKDGIDSRLVLKMLRWIAEGYIGTVSEGISEDMDSASVEFKKCLDILKKNLYKEEYL